MKLITAFSKPQATTTIQSINHIASTYHSDNLDTLFDMEHKHHMHLPHPHLEFKKHFEWCMMAFIDVYSKMGTR